MTEIEKTKLIEIIDALKSEKDCNGDNCEKCDTIKFVAKYLDQYILNVIDAVNHEPHTAFNVLAYILSVGILIGKRFEQSKKMEEMFTL